MSGAYAQDQWIDFSKNYYKISTAEEGVYRLSFTTFSASGINLNNVDPRDIRLYHRGNEVAIFAPGQEDGRFDPADYIEFLGKKNDATLDYGLYKDPADLPNPYYNTHNDTTAYFLTITPGVRGLRMAGYGTASPTAPTVDIFQAERLLVFNDQYNLGQVYNPGVRLPEFDRGQGWMGPIITRGNHLDYSLLSLGTIMNAGEFKLEVGLVGRLGAPHTTGIFAGPNAGSLRQVEVITYGEYDVRQVELDLQFTDFNPDGSILIRIGSLGQQSTTDNVSLSYLKLKYPRRAASGDFAKNTFSYDIGSNNFELSGVQGNYVGYEISDYDRPKQVNVVKLGNNLRLPGSGTSGSTKIMLQQTNTITNVDVMRRVRFRDVLSQKADYLIITHQALRRPGAVYGDAVEAYASYRASPAGGGFDTLTVNMDQLYNQFSYGEKSPLAIYNFVKAYYPRHQPEYLLLLGRALGIFSTARQNNINYNYRQNPSAFPFQDLVPAAGYPYSDAPFAHGLDPEFPDLEALPLGRIPARTPDEVAAYLDKIKEKDALGVKEEWQKNLIHLSGGLSALELNRYFTFMNGFKNIAEDVFLGGNVKTFRKRTNATVELINISDEVNQGTSLVTFFGHASPSLIDIEIGFASDQQLGYTNKGRYPVLLLNGCDAGNAYGTAYTFGEDWVLTRDKGSSHFIAHTNLGIDVFLRRYSESFYQKAFSDSSMIYQSIGKVRTEAERALYRRYGTAPVYRSHSSMMVMLGDPASKMFPAPKADYEIRAADITLEGPDGEVLNAMHDTLSLNIVIRNLGRVDLDSFNLNVSRRLPDGTVISYDPKLLKPIYRKDTITFAIPNRAVNAFGENFFTIEVNKDRRVDELNYLNNTVSTSYFIQLNGTINLMPLSFGIESKTNTKLISQITGSTTELRTVLFQMDTAHNFTSAARREMRVSSTDLATWDLDYSALVGNRDSVTVYWRTRFLEPRAGESDQWSVSSFSYIRQGPEGWTQRRLPQFNGNAKNQLVTDLGKNEWRFEKVGLDISVFTFGNAAPSLTFQNTQILMDGIPYILNNVNNVNSRLCPNGSLGLLTYQKKDLTPYLVFPPPGFDVLDGNTCGRVPQIIQSIRNATILNNTQFLIDYVDGVGDGDYILIFSVGNVNFADWPDAAYVKLKEFGANEATLRNLKNGDPYILFGKKGMKPGEALELVADQNLEEPTNTQVLNFETSLEGHFTSGSIITPRVGPASEWREFFSHMVREDLFNKEMTQMDLIGVSPEGTETVLMADVKQNQLSLESINPLNYPYLRLKYAMEDPDADLPSQLMKWQVNYTGVPEGVLIYKAEENGIQLREGEERSLKFRFDNISRHDFMDSLVVDWLFNNRDLNKMERFTKKIPAVPAGGSHEFNIDFSSIGKAGLNSLNVFANPRIVMEQSYRNNIIDLNEYITVLPDDSNPILDVNFDGIYIMDGDIVSPTVLISALMKDAGAILQKKDTLGMEVMMRKNCEGCLFERVNFSNPNLKWYAATENSDYKIEYQPGPLEDGLYTLRINATDAAGNKAGEKPYEITFEVVNESQITNFYPYPNPFSSSVRFVFTVTGAQIPDQLKIQIMTVTGKVVREILQDELGPIRIGNNLSDYAWDGKDEFGDQLANGVYIYRVLVLQNGQFMEHRATAGDKAFKKGYGKMYLLR
jgi:hypothetical protein